MPSVYLETTVISYLTAYPSRDIVVLAHQQITREWWDEHLTQFEPFISSIVIEEIERGDSKAAVARLEAVRSFSLLKLVPEVKLLADDYYAGLSLPEQARADAVHLALCAWHGVDYLLTWNCAHIASARVKRIVDEINLRWNIRTPILCTPEELMDGG